MHVIRNIPEIFQNVHQSMHRRYNVYNEVAGDYFK